MSTQPLGSSTTSPFGTLSTTGAGAPIQITGLASGLDTNSIIQKLIAIQKLPITALTNQQTGLQAKNTQLASIQTAMQSLAVASQALADPSLFTNTQTATSTNASRVSASTISGQGAVVGGYQVGVSALASSAQRTYTFTSPAAADTVSIDGQAISLAAGASLKDLVSAVNSNKNASVWATATDANTLVLSDRATGNNASYIQVTDPGGSIAEQTSLAQAGQNASFTINNGAPQSSQSNTVTTAIPGVTLNLNGTTTAAGPETINVSSPAPSTQSVQTATQAFVTSYNSVIQQIQTQLAQKPSASDPTVGTLFGDPSLKSLLSSMRQMMYTADSTLPAGLASMGDLGVSTGAATGSLAPSQSAISGQLTLDASALATALTSNATGVRDVLTSWSIPFTKIVNDEAASGGAISSRITGESGQISDLGQRITSLNSLLTDKQNTLTAQFAALEGALSQSQSMSTWLTSQISSLPTA